MIKLNFYEYFIFQKFKIYLFYKYLNKMSAYTNYF